MADGSGNRTSESRTACRAVLLCTPFNVPQYLYPMVAKWSFEIDQSAVPLVPDPDVLCDRVLPLGY
ncbi:MAG: hypothetical protein KJ672_04455, partial [Candidatus Thermoplasmatota archaeon]|nr:hypothetical protein [Candidatus Thermoplasmatota archaeon]